MKCPDCDGELEAYYIDDKDYDEPSGYVCAKCGFDSMNWLHKVWEPLK